MAVFEQVGKLSALLRMEVRDGLVDDLLFQPHRVDLVDGDGSIHVPLVTFSQPVIVEVEIAGGRVVHPVTRELPLVSWWKRPNNVAQDMVLDVVQNEVFPCDVWVVIDWGMFFCALVSS